MAKFEVLDLPSAERLHELFTYDPKTGVFTWLVDRGSNKTKGTQAGWLGKNGYFYLNVDDRKYLAHRIAWKMQTGKDPAETIDHKIGTSNEWSNLREATHVENGTNKRTKKSQLSLKGTSFHEGAKRFRATIKPMGGGKQIHIGFFDTREGAHKAYVDAARRLHGEFANDGNGPIKPTKKISAAELRKQLGIGIRLSNNNTSGKRGVSWSEDRKMYQAYANVSGKRHSLGRYKTINESIEARDKFLSALKKS